MFITLDVGHFSKQYLENPTQAVKNIGIIGEHMSTRCQIQVKFLDREILLYHHHDGYPEGVGADLIKRQQALKSWNGSILVNNLIKDKNEEYEISYVIHTYLDYWYEINCNKRTIKCWKVKGYLLSDHAEVKKGEEIPLQYNSTN